MERLNLNIKAIIAWCIYDWGLTAFPVIINTFVIATYFTSKIATNPILGTHQWGNAVALAGIITALFCPILGAVANTNGKLNHWLGAFTLLVIISSTLLWFAYPEVASVNLTLACVVLGTIGVNVCMVFYNSMIVTLAPEDYWGRVSGWGWGLGYFGGLAVLIIALFCFVNSPPLWLNASTFEQIRICGPLVGLWVLLFAIPLFFMVPEQAVSHFGLWYSFRTSFKNLSSTFKIMLRKKNIITFLIAQMIYIDGLNTLFAFGGIYAAGTFHMALKEILLLGIAMNIFAGIGSIALAWLDDCFGSKFTIYLSLALLSLSILGAVLVSSKMVFCGLCCLFSLFVGPVQSSSRSLMTHIIPKEHATQLFGFYVFSGKVSTFIGPWVFGLLTYEFNSQRAGLASLLVFFVIGAFILRFVRVPKGH